jgi:hypothetical protein
MREVSDLPARIARLEALEQIRQLPARYALALDMRNFDLLVTLFVDDIGVPGKQTGRQALKRWFDAQLRTDIVESGHAISGHVIDVHDASSASGVVYSRNDLETPGGVWIHEFMAYLDRYERREDRWYFRRRTPLFWFQSDATAPPTGPEKMRWPDRERFEGAFHDAFASWEQFWQFPDTYADAPVADPVDVDEFIATLRGQAPIPRVNPGGGAATAPTAHTSAAAPA